MGNELSATAKRYQKLYEQGRVTKTGLKRAVAKGLIEEYEYEIITGEEYVALT